MRRKISILLCTVLLFLPLTGCKDVVAGKKEAENRFIRTGNMYVIRDDYYIEIVDTKTNNLYITNSSGITPLYDENGEIAKYKQEE